jgi:hypothetical protein
MSENMSFSAYFHDPNRFQFSRFESRAGTGRYVESHAARFIAFEFECRVYLEEMKMTSDLDWAISQVADLQLYCSSSIIRGDGLRFQKIFARNHHRIGS